MKLSISYKEILQISLPLIIASFGHSLIGATDTFFLGRSGDTTYLAAIGLVAPFYFVVTLVSLALSRGGQIMVARRLGQGELTKIGLIGRNMLYFEIGLAVFVFLIWHLCGYFLLSTFIDSSELLDISQGYLDYRILGVFFGCAGVAFVSLYSGVARTGIIILSSAVVAVINVFLNYALIFGNWGFPQMGMNGAGLASAIAEGFGLLAFVLFAIYDKNSKAYKLFKRSAIDFQQIKAQFHLSAPIALQNFLGLIAWVVLFGLIEDLGEEPMAISSIIRVIYLFIGAIAWGVGSATNTMISVLMGAKKHKEIMPTLHRITIFTVVFSAVVGSLLLIFPSQTVQLITDDEAIIQGAIPMMSLLFIIIINLSIYTIYYNGIIGTGDIQRSLWITFLGVGLYIGYVIIVINVLKLDMYWAWSAEIIYGLFTLALSLFYLKKAKWKTLII